MHINKLNYGFYRTTIMAGLRPSAESSAKRVGELIKVGSDTIIPINDECLGLSITLTEIDQFNHPVYLHDFKKMLLDDRNLRDKTDTVRRGDTHGELVTRAKLDKLWIEEPVAYVDIALPLSAVFGRWAGRSLTRAHNLGMESVKVEFIMSLYYLMLTSGRAYKGLDTWKGAFSTLGSSRFLALPKAVFIDIIESDELANIVRAFEDSDVIDKPLSLLIYFTNLLNVKTSLGNFNLEAKGLIATLSKGGWANSILGEQLTASAIEHPPTLTWMITQALSLSFHRRSAIGSVVDDSKRKFSLDNVSNFVREVMYE